MNDNSKIKIINNPLLLAEDSLKNFANLFGMNEFEIVSTQPSLEVTVEGILDCFKNVKTYQTILDDKNAVTNYFSIKYKSEYNDDIIMPIGVYGFSSLHRIRYPLLLNAFWRAFLMLSKADYLQIAEVLDDIEGEASFNNLLELKRRFLDKIFNYYASIDSVNYSAMCWEKRNEISMTRLSAESVPFIRLTDGNAEYYLSEEINDNTWHYLRKCSDRWSGIKVDDLKNEEGRNEKYTFENLNILIEHALNFR